MSTTGFTLTSSITATFADHDIPAGPVLRAAGLPEDLFLHGPVTLTPEQFYRCWTAMEELSGDPELGIRVVERTSTETFQPPLFAALCSPHLRRAAERIAVHKRLLGPQRLLIGPGDELHLTMGWPPDPPPPPGLVVYELALWVAIARLATRARVVPARIAVPDPPGGTVAASWRDYLGVPLGRAAEPVVVFAAHDARRPFLTANAEMWRVFEPDLRRRLADLERAESMAERVRAALVELLPAGEGTTAGVARRLALSGRTLQRRLAAERTTFQAVLDTTRHALARTYLNRPDVSIPEIAFLLGYDEPSSFYRAFRQWSGTTPQRARAR
ncbi:helix-turn-helix transcriptional regulator [Catenuloplanes atrovinosus]|uniref:AraC-like DNA-binding protein n=1 Tax=Catenuloplanes atrovinosus TaxID=137266 RepID=A0AAE3YI00_9ACTN|nr:AraC family transcriptional regulator ligand-binding domain-containing protein [Catenuloplanes atrovinosus]MDR7274039.1 AraC-like DNA-binding protein [Catenuloplanes atrovinosus]